MQVRSDGDGWLKALSGSSKWRVAEGEQVVAAWRASGESMSGFARKHGLNVERIAYWRDRVSSDSALPVKVEPAAGSFVPVIVRSQAESRVSAAMTLIAGGGRIDVFDAQRLDPRWLAALVGTLNGESRR